MIEGRIYSFLFIGLFSILLLSGCKTNQFSPEQVITNALEAEKDLSYYGEIEMNIDGLDDADSTVVKEWRLNEKARVEMEVDGESVITVNDGEKLIIYEEKENRVFTVEDENLQELNMNPKEQVEMLLDMIRDTHDLETVGEEEIAGRPTFHMVATKQKDDKSLFGDQEFWIDKEHWVVLKMKSISGDNESNIEYTKIEFDQKIDESLFELDLPEDVVMEDMNDGYLEEEISLTDIPDKLDQPVLYIPDGNERMLDKITYLQIEGEMSYQDITIDYKQNELPLMTLTILHVEDEDSAAEEELLEGGFETEKIRGREGLFMDLNELRSISWTEGGLRYSINIIDPNLTLTTVKKWAEEMEEIN